MTIWAVTGSEDHNCVLSGGADGAIKVWPLRASVESDVYSLQDYGKKIGIKCVAMMSQGE